MCRLRLSYKLNQPYNLDADGYLRGNPAKQAAQMEAEVSEDEMIADEIAEAEVNETLASAIEEAREDYQADVERRKVQARSAGQSKGTRSEDCCCVKSKTKRSKAESLISSSRCPKNLLLLILSRRRIRGRE